MKKLTMSVILGLLIGPTTANAQVGTAFTYQGRLTDAGSPANGAFDFEFQLFTLASGGTGSTTQTLGDVTVASGLFTVKLDFGAEFTGSPRWLEIRVRPGVSVLAYTTLAPRQELTPSPNAVFAASSGTVATNGVNTTQIADGAVTSLKLGPGAVTAGAIASGQVVKSLNGLADTVTITGSGGATVSTVGSTITVAAPPPLPAGAVVLGASGDTTLIGSGYTELAPAADAWAATATAGAPSARGGHTAVWTGTKMIVWGGDYLSTGGVYDPVGNSWMAIATPGGLFGRSEHTAVWTGSKMIVWGGWNGSAVFDTGLAYDPVSDQWQFIDSQTQSGFPSSPSGRRGHTAVWTGSKMIVWGGLDANGLSLNTGGQYIPAVGPVLESWTETSITGSVPSAREKHTAVWTGTKMIVWGGWDLFGTSLNTGGQYDPAVDSWTATSTTGSVPIGRNRHTAVWTGSKMIVWGGLDGTYTLLNTGGQYDPAVGGPGGSWTATSITDVVPSARVYHTAVWTGSKMIVWGGGVQQGYVNTGGQYDPAVGGPGGSWTATSITGSVPLARAYHTAVWTGSKMIVWGGTGIVAVGNTGGQRFELSYFVKN